MGCAREQLPAVAWVFTNKNLSYVITHDLRGHQQFVEWVYQFLGARVRIVNNDHRDALVWWLDGTSAKKQGVVRGGGGVFERSSFISHRW